MKSLKTPLILTLGLSVTLGLAGCSSADEPQPAQTFTVQPTASAEATPAEGSSGEIDLNKTATDLKTSETAPEWAAAFLGNLPEAKWVYASDDNQVIATTDSFDPTELKGLLDKLTAEGWQVSVPGEDVNGSFIQAMVNPKTGESVTVIGMEKAIPGPDGQPDKPASSVVYKK